MVASDRTFAEMGDPARFRALADLVEVCWPDRDLRIADVAGGKGHLRAELYLRGYRRVKVVDVRPGKTHRDHYLYGRFTDHHPGRFQLVLGMHPDEATDEIVAYAVRHRVPFAVVPCCILPSAYPFTRPHSRNNWRAHLCDLAIQAGFDVSVSRLAMRGSNHAVVGVPRDR